MAGWSSPTRETECAALSRAFTNRKEFEQHMATGAVLWFNDTKEFGVITQADGGAKTSSATILRSRPMGSGPSLRATTWSSTRRRARRFCRRRHFARSPDRAPSRSRERKPDLEEAGLSPFRGRVGPSKTGRRAARGASEGPRLLGNPSLLRRSVRYTRWVSSPSPECSWASPRPSSAGRRRARHSLTRP